MRTSRKMYKFPSIEQFRSVVRNVNNKASFKGLDETGEPIYDHLAIKPTLTFTGTVKLHGTNLSIVLTRDGDYYAQSRERIMELTSDNAGSCQFAMKEQEFFVDYLNSIMQRDDGIEAVAVYGEWAGAGIQKGVGISNIEKSFFPFAVQVIMKDGKSHWHKTELPSSPKRGVHSLEYFSCFKIDIDFNNPDESVNKMVAWVEEVERECPVAKEFGHSGIGEGIVFSCGEHMFKVKGEKHSVSKVKTLIPVDTEKLESMKAFIEYAVTEQRLQQGVDELVASGKQPVPESLGTFLAWINRDVIKEEQDAINANGLENKVVAKHVSTAARTWFISKYS